MEMSLALSVSQSCNTNKNIDSGSILLLRGYMTRFGVKNHCSWRIWLQEEELIFAFCYFQPINCCKFPENRWEVVAYSKNCMLNWAIYIGVWHKS